MQDAHSAEGMKFPDFSRLQLNFYVCPRLFMGSGSMLHQKIFKIKMLKSDENELYKTKFPNFFSLHKNSLTFPGFPGHWTPCIWVGNPKEQNLLNQEKIVYDLL